MPSQKKTDPLSLPAEWITPPVSAPRVRRHLLDSRAAKTTISYHIFVPEVYDLDSTRQLPVVYWLHGTGAGTRNIPQLAACLDTAIRKGTVPPLLMVFPNGLVNSLWVDSKDGSVPMETVIMKELLPHIDTNYRTVASQQGRMIEGFSMGGYGAARLGFKYPGIFGAVSILSGGPLQQEFLETPLATPEERARVLKHVFGNDHAYFRELSPWVLLEQNAQALRSCSHIRMVVGALDKMTSVVRRFSAHMTDLGVPHAYAELPGVEHSSVALLGVLGDAYWSFHREVFDSLPTA